MLFVRNCNLTIEVISTKTEKAMSTGLILKVTGMAALQKCLERKYCFVSTIITLTQALSVMCLSTKTGNQSYSLSERTALYIVGIKRLRRVFI